MPINTNGLQELLSVIANQKAMQMREAERAQEQQNFNAKFEEDKKRYKDALKMDEAKFKAERADRKAIEDRMAAQFQLMKQQRLDEIQQRANETGQLPTGAIDLRQFAPEALPIGVGGVVIPGLGQINPQDPREYAKLQGELELAKDKPKLDMVQAFQKTLQEQKDAADIKQAEIRAAEQERATTENNETRRQYNEGMLALRNQVAANQTATRNEATDRREQLDELRRQAASKLTTAQTNALVSGRDMDTLVDEVVDLLHANITKGSFKGKKVLDSEFSEGLKEKVLNFGKRVYDEKVANVSSPEISDFRAKLEDIQEKSRKDIYGAAFTSTEEKRAFLNRLDQLKHARNKEEAKSIIADIQERIKRNRESAYKALTPIQQEYLDEALKPAKKFVTDAKTGKRVLR